MMKKKILFMIPSLAGGGAEKVFLNLVKRIDKKLFDVTLVYLNDHRNVYEISSDIITINLNSKRLRNAPLKILNLIRKEKPDLIISTLNHMNLLLIMIKPFFPKNTKLIVRLTNIISMNLSNNPLKRSFLKLIFKSYKMADKIICQSKLMRDDLVNLTGIDTNKIKIIYNPVDLTNIQQKSMEEINYKIRSDFKNIFFVGRLDEVKRIPLIIEAFKNYYKNQPKSNLFIIGDGPLKEKIKSIIKNQNLSKSIHLLGFQSNPYKWLRKADLFVLASKHEGMPNVLIEALALNVPVLILSHPGGTIDVLKELGIENRFVQELVISESSFRPYDKDLSKMLKNKFGVERIVKKYENTFIEVLRT